MSRFLSIIIGGSFKARPKTTGKPRSPLVPWWNEKCVISRIITRACYKRYKRRPILVNKISNSRKLAIQKRVFKEARRDLFSKYISELKYNSPLSMVWDSIRKLEGKFSPHPLPILKINLMVISEAKEVAEAFAQHFSSISSANHYSP